MEPVEQMKLHSITKASKLMGIGKDNLYRLISEGKIGTITIGKRQKISQTELEKFIRDYTIRYNKLAETNISTIDIERHFHEKQKYQTDLFLQKLKEEFY